MENSGICVDLVISEGQDAKKINRLRERLATRISPPDRAQFYDATRERWTFLVGGERPMLERIASRYFRGTLLGVDGITLDGINIAARVTEIELERIKQLPDQFRISAEMVFRQEESYSQ
jgi:hypothetical protein